MKEDRRDKEAMLDAFEEKLNAIILKSEMKKTTQLVDILTAILLSLATVGSAWCAYQSNLWNGIQTFKLMDAHQAGRFSSQKSLEAIQLRSIDATLLMQYINAGKAGDKELADFYFSRFNPVLKTATLEWLKLDPFTNQNAPNSPLKMPSYKLPEEEKSLENMNLYYKEMDSANLANHNADTYVMFTVIFAAVLFFGGIASTLQSNLMRNICLILSGIIFISTFIFLLNLPLAKLFE